MPELPEVETVVRGLEGIVSGKQIAAVRILHKKPLGKLRPAQFKAFLIGESVQAVVRRGKYILFRFQSGKSMVVHLRMTGKFIYRSKKEAIQPHKHIRLVLTFTDNDSLVFQDMRLFATFSLYTNNREIKEIQKLGPDPFSPEVTSRWLKANLMARKTPLKTVLLDQRFLSGLGNIYVCEALHRSGLNPTLPANKLTLAQAARLVESMRSVLRLAIKYNGTTIRDFSGIDEKSGGFQKMLRVYGKSGELCPTCRKTAIMRIKQGGRSSFFCPRCQALGVCALAVILKPHKS